MAMADEMQIGFQHPVYIVVFKKGKNLSPAHDSCRKQYTSLSSGLKNFFISICSIHFHWLYVSN